jgi:hypothetical protein
LKCRLDQDSSLPETKPHTLINEKPLSNTVDTFLWRGEEKHDKKKKKGRKSKGNSKEQKQREKFEFGLAFGCGVKMLVKLAR